jgi:hypothetical protein
MCGDFVAVGDSHRANALVAWRNLDHFPRVQKRCGRSARSPGFQAVGVHCRRTSALSFASVAEISATDGARRRRTW